MTAKSKKILSVVIKATIITLIIVIAVVCIIKAVLVRVLPGRGSAEEILDRDKKELETIVSFFEKSDIKEFYLHYMDEGDIDEAIDDEKTRNAMKKLINRGYNVILKEGNTIKFSVWTFFRAGIAYSIDGVHEPKIDYVIKLEPLSKDKWYYYRSE